MSRAGSDLMDLLHGLAATALTEELGRAIEASRQPKKITKGEEEVDNPAYAPINPQLIDKALKFLKDNGIDAPKANQKIDELAGVLENLDLDETAHSLPN